LAEHFSIRHISTGDLLRDAVRDQTEIGRKVEPMLEQGVLVPDDVVLDLVCDEARRADWEHLGFVLDGFPRTVAQAEAFFAVAGSIDDDATSHPEIGLDAAIELDVPIETVLDRLARRRVCPVCGTTVTVDDPAIDVVPCPLGHGPAVRRDDDQPEAIQRRLALYEKETGPLLPWFAKRGLLVRVDGTGSPDEVFARILAALGHLPEPVADRARRPSR
jgi:adenylate kinase